MTPQPLNSEYQPVSVGVKNTEASPFLLEFFMVEGKGFRGMAYCDQEGKWHKAFNNEELRGAISIVE